MGKPNPKKATKKASEESMQVDNPPKDDEVQNSAVNSAGEAQQV